MATRTKEFVVALENRPGTLAELTRALASANVNITAIDCEGLGDFGTARLLTNDVGKTETTLKGKG
ncbi:MAG TPA: ACT domain-containing protein, partial [Candidatus Thermoplasmatota archaeon]|nr:ACT domain-containing protein [Candidatus Thermoplasmatota archaeon]